MPSIKYFQSQDQNGREGVRLKPILFGVLGGVVLSFLLLLLFSLLMLYSGMPVSYAPIIAKIILFLGALFSGLFAGKGRNNSGWFFGALAGLCYVFVLIAAGIIFTDANTLSAGTISSVLTCILVGALGGIMGINLKSSKKKVKKH